MADELLPCPFCGREAEQDFQQAYRSMQTGRIDHGAAVYCTGCNANMIMCRSDHPELSDEERMAVVVEDWNRRTPSPSTHVADFHLTEWERKELLQIAAANTLTYLAHHAHGGLRPHEVEKMELWKALSDKLKTPSPQPREVSE